MTLGVWSASGPKWPKNTSQVHLIPNQRTSWPNINHVLRIIWPLWTDFGKITHTSGYPITPLISVQWLANVFKIWFVQFHHINSCFEEFFFLFKYKLYACGLNQECVWNFLFISIQTVGLPVCYLSEVNDVLSLSYPEAAKHREPGTFSLFFIKFNTKNTDCFLCRCN